MTIMVASNVFKLRGGDAVAKGVRIAEDGGRGSKVERRERRSSEPHKLVRRE
jgi:hypothetical protein